MTEKTHFTQSKKVFQWMKTNCGAGIQPGLQRMEQVLEKMGNPERRLKFIHIAGTNGKGSTAAMVASVLQEAGYPTGMFTSPYLDHWSERIRMDGQPIDKEAFLLWAQRVASVVEELKEKGMEPPTEFEFWTLIAINYFARDAVPWFVVWETGLGGRLDSTNVVYPLVSVVTHIGHDHTRLLGSNLQEIAAEKAGIIKPGVPVVSGCQQEEVIEVLCNKAKENRSTLYQLGRDFTGKRLSEEDESQTFRFSGPFQEYDSLTIPLMGPHQVNNGAVAMMTLEVLRQYYATILERETVITGLKQTDWPGRLEKISEHPTVLLDGAHNPEAAAALADALSSRTYERLHLLIGVLEDKEVKGILSPLLPLADQVVAVQVNHERTMSAEKLLNIIREIDAKKSVHTGSSLQSGLAELKKNASAKDLIVVTGSLFLISELRRTLINKKEG